MGKWWNWLYTRRLGRRPERVEGSNPSLPTLKFTSLLVRILDSREERGRLVGGIETIFDLFSLGWRNGPFQDGLREAVGVGLVDDGSLNGDLSAVIRAVYFKTYACSHDL